ALRQSRSVTWDPSPACPLTPTMAASSACWQHGRAGRTLASSALISSVNDGRSRIATHHLTEPVLIKIGIDPVLVTIGGLKIHWYGIVIAIGVYAGIQVALADSPRRGIDRDRLMHTASIASVLGVLGGRLT